MKTRTGSFPIGFRLGWTEWFKNLPAVTAWARQQGFEAVDVGRFKPEDLTLIRNAGLSVGTVDLIDFHKLCAPDAGERKATIDANVEYIKTAGSGGAKTFFTIVPGEASRKRAENYRIAVESFGPLAQAADSVGAKIVIEGYPGGPPHYALLCCTPETCRSFIKDVGGKSVGLNYDPSHLIRLGVDPIRFVKEFTPHIYHVHGKDTELMPEAVYEYGLYQDSVIDPGHGFGQNVWRYTIPGSGQMRWTEGFKILSSAGYKGFVCIELEDENFNGSEDGEKAGLKHGLAFLAGA
jgi:sugar phosphate isomerase/epimerase